MLPLTPESHVGPEGVEPSSGPYKEPALAVELRARLALGPEGVEPTPCRLKGGYAAITPRPRRSNRTYGFQWVSPHHLNLSLLLTTHQIVRGGLAPATGDVSDRHAPVTPPDHE